MFGIILSGPPSRLDEARAALVLAGCTRVESHAQPEALITVCGRDVAAACAAVREFGWSVTRWTVNCHSRPGLSLVLSLAGYCNN